MKENEGMYAYIRVSSTDQNVDRQMLAIQQLELPRSHIFIDRVSGKDFDRPQWQEPKALEALANLEGCEWFYRADASGLGCWTYFHLERFHQIIDHYLFLVSGLKICLEYFIWKKVLNILLLVCKYIGFISI